jgi:hypothetical protein
MSRQRHQRPQDHLELFDVVRVSEFQLDLGDESFRIRLEMTRSRRTPRLYRANVWRTEYFRIQPTFPQKQGRPAHKPSDEIVWLDWTGVLRAYGEPFRAGSLAKAEELALDELGAWVHHTRAECGGPKHTWGECPAGAKTS